MDTLTLSRVLSAITWIALALIMAPPVWRLLRRRGRSLDAIWGCGFLLCINRIAFLADAMVAAGSMRTWCYVTSICAGALYGWVAWGYQRHDS